MPPSWRISRFMALPARTLRPPTSKSPPSIGSSALMQRSSVDFPEPDRPINTTPPALANLQVHPIEHDMGRKALVDIPEFDDVHRIRILFSSTRKPSVSTPISSR